MGVKYRKLIGFEDLPLYFHIELDKNFRKHLFENARGNRTWRSLAKKIGYSETRLTCLRKGYRIIYKKKEKNLLSINILKKLSKISQISMKEIEKHVISMRVGRGGCYSLKLPIYESPELASILAHSLGDGHLRNIFVYFNERKELIERVKDDVKVVFGNIKFKTYLEEEGIRVVFPSIVGRLLYAVGGVKFNKTMQEYDVPEWIKYSNKKVKIEFVRALFDDEGSVDIKHRSIVFQMSNNSKFLLSFLELLREFGIQSNLNALEKYRDGKDNEKIMYGFTIGKFENIMKYKINIGFCHLEKEKLLLDLLENFKKVHYLYEDIEEKILCILSKKGSVTKKNLMRDLNRSDESIRVHLNRLSKKNLVIKINDCPSTWKTGDKFGIS